MTKFLHLSFESNRVINSHMPHRHKCSTVHSLLLVVWVNVWWIVVVTTLRCSTLLHEAEYLLINLILFSITVLSKPSKGFRLFVSLISIFSIFSISEFLKWKKGFRRVKNEKDVKKWNLVAEDANPHLPNITPTFVHNPHHVLSNFPTPTFQLPLDPPPPQKGWNYDDPFLSRYISIFQSKITHHFVHSYFYENHTGR